MTSEQPETPTPQPTTDEPQPPQPAFGWTEYAERINGRFAMIGFVALLILEFITRQDLWTWLGLR
ncbi:chlorophyll a/b-binding protein [Phormidium sp. CCY1219]|uniref:chlorophyll a/b-binding protein n=1 Tax=Phormidium sp. CCY1219 TaxID=2886104 RepID=UPI002D1F367C|nr:chlorophyll a/b-binding protein [Phormidium sp. CCY1219]MEB3828338.1 high light inducible protein [Phormidium sp. CCY1219]